MAVEFNSNQLQDQWVTCPPAPITAQPKSTISFWVDEGNAILHFRVVESDGTMREATVNFL